MAIGYVTGLCYTMSNGIKKYEGNATPTILGNVLSISNSLINTKSNDDGFEYSLGYDADTYTYDKAVFVKPNETTTYYNYVKLYTGKLETYFPIFYWIYNKKILNKFIGLGIIFPKQNQIESGQTYFYIYDSNHSLIYTYTKEITNPNDTDIIKGEFNYVMDEDHYLLTNFDYPYTSTSYISFDYDLKGKFINKNNSTTFTAYYGNGRMEQSISDIDIIKTEKNLTYLTIDSSIINNDDINAIAIWFQDKSSSSKEELNGVNLRINGSDRGDELIIHNGNSYTVKVTYKVIKKNNTYTSTVTIPANSDFATGVMDSGGIDLDPNQSGSEYIGEVSLISVTRPRTI